jgi:anti-sigma-K factor RskA
LNVSEIISSGLLELYVLGKTTEQETAQVLAWKQQYAEVAEELFAIELSLEQFDVANAIKPSNAAKQNIFAAIKAEGGFEANASNKIAHTTEAKVVKFNYWKYAAAAAIALLVGSTIFNISTQNKLKDRLAKAETELTNQKQLIASLNEEIEGVANNSSQQIVLKGTPSSPTSTAKIFWVRNTGEVLVEASGLPAAPQGMQYQLWAIVDGKPADAGMIEIDNKGRKYNFQKMKSFGKAQAFAITLEKAGGSPTPTMEKMVVIAEI